MLSEYGRVIFEAPVDVKMEYYNTLCLDYRQEVSYLGLGPALQSRPVQIDLYRYSYKIARLCVCCCFCE